MPYIFVRSNISHLDDGDAFDVTRWRLYKTVTYIDFQLVKDGNDQPLTELIETNLSARRRVHNLHGDIDSKQAKYQTYECHYPPHVVFNELEIHAGYKVIAANTTTETSVWTLHKPWSHITAERQQYAVEVFKFA